MSDGSSMFEAIAGRREVVDDGRGGAARFVRFRGMTKHCVRIFDMSSDEERKEYEELVPALNNGMVVETHHVWENSREMVPSSDGSVRILKYVEWSEYEVGEDMIEHVGG